MTNKEIKELSIEFWQYLYDHPYILIKEDVEKELWDKVKDYKSHSPLCEKFLDNECVGCPLYKCGESNSLHFGWLIARRSREREIASMAIIERLKEWEV